MADRWNETRDERWRERGYGRDRDDGADAWEGREDRSFQPRRSAVGDAGRGPVFGERETGVSYSGPSYGAGGYTGYGERAYGERGYGERNYSTGQGRYGADIYQERQARRSYGDDRGRRSPREDYEAGPDYSAYGYDRSFRGGPVDHSEFGFGYDLGGRDYARGRARREYEDDYGRRDGEGLWDRTRRFFGRDRDDERQAGHRGLGPQGYRRSDERINDDVHDRLTEDPHLDASRISVTVKDGEVTLSGQVSDRHAKHHAEHIVEDLSGVKHVQNNLRVEDRTRAAGTQTGATTGSASPLGENSKLNEQAAGKA